MISSLCGSGLVVAFTSEEGYLHARSLASFPDFLQAAFSCALRLRKHFSLKGLSNRPQFYLRSTSFICLYISSF